MIVAVESPDAIHRLRAPEKTDVIKIGIPTKITYRGVISRRLLSPNLLFANLIANQPAKAKRQAGKFAHRLPVRQLCRHWYQPR